MVFSLFFIKTTSLWVWLGGVGVGGKSQALLELNTG